MFPGELKLAYTLPLYKNDDPYAFYSYRPVSLLNVLSKVFSSYKCRKFLSIKFWLSQTSFLLHDFNDVDA